MYNDFVFSRLKDLTFSGMIKNSNISILSKKNDFNDMVKFYAQINSKDIIQKISFKANGCSAFMVACSVFCELIENKTVVEALKINENNMDNILNLDDSHKHVYEIILKTFVLLIKKYRKGIENGKILPVNDDFKSKNQDTKENNKKDKEVLVSKFSFDAEKMQPKLVSNKSKNSNIDNIESVINYNKDNGLKFDNFSNLNNETKKNSSNNENLDSDKIIDKNIENSISSNKSLDNIDKKSNEIIDGSLCVDIKEDKNIDSLNKTKNKKINKISSIFSNLFKFKGNKNSNIDKNSKKKSDEINDLNSKKKSLTNLINNLKK